MNFSLKSLSRSVALIAAMTVASCAPTGPASPANDIVISKQTIALTSLKTADTSDVTLVCGCPYNLTVVSFKGDTNVITYSIPNLALGQAVNLYSVIVKGSGSATSGTYTSQLILKGGGEGYIDTINTTYIVP